MHACTGSTQIYIYIVSVCCSEDLLMHALLFYFTLQKENLDEQIAEKNINYYRCCHHGMDFSASEHVFSC